ncbi:MAG: hypothetical protein M1812_004426 [Candelaria pacifica]|nr:MAG: hypothetical protein M1812_004426 [Candelaria pacifica]
MSFAQKRSEFFPPKPTLTEKNLHDLSGKVYMITGGTSGIGLELARILYSKNAKVYITGRSPQSAFKAIEDIKSHPSIDTRPNKGELIFLKFDLTDLPSIKPAIDSFLRKETALHSVWYNAGVMNTPKGAKTVQGYELQWGTNVVAHFLLNLLLIPILRATAKVAKPNSVRTIWVSSLGHDLYSPPNGGINWEDINNEKGKMGEMECYGQSKAAGVILGYETGKKLGGDGVVSVSLNPGNLRSNLLRDEKNTVKKTLINAISYESRMGALTELFAGFSDQVGSEGQYVIPWGRVGCVRKDIKDGYTQQGTGSKLWELLEGEVAQYAQ